MHRDQYKESRITKKQLNIILSKETNTAVTDCKEAEIYEIPDKEFRYTDDTTLMAESEEELKSLQIKVKEESEKVV